jgi:hypothetical protein
MVDALDMLGTKQRTISSSPEGVLLAMSLLTIQVGQIAIHLELYLEQAPHLQ